MATISSPPSATWDSMSELRAVPVGGVHSAQFTFGGTNPVAASVVYLECVEDDRGPTNHPDGTFAELGQYSVGDRVICPGLTVTHNGTLIKVVNSTPQVPWENDANTYLLPPVKNSIPSAGFLDKTRPSLGSRRGNFVLSAVNAHKYRLRCFASHTVQPGVSTSEPYFDQTIVFTAAQIEAMQTQPFFTIPHSQGVAPDIVEINLIFNRDIYGYSTGTVLPLKFIGGNQGVNGAGTSADPLGIWTTSADTSNVYFGVSGEALWITTQDGNPSSVNLFPSTNVFFDMQICIKKDYPTPEGVTFLEQALPAGVNLDSAVIPESASGAGILEHDMILVNKKAGASGYNNQYKIYVNQCGGTHKDDYTKVSLFQFYDPTTKKLKFRRTLAAYTSGEKAWLLWNKTSHQPFDVAEDNKLAASEWVCIFRWQYENPNTNFDIDTGWMTLNRLGMTQGYAHWGDGGLGFHKGTSNAKKLDIYFRGKLSTPSPHNPHRDNGSVIPLSTLSGGGISYTPDSKNKATKIGNAFCLSYGPFGLQMSNTTQYKGRGTACFPIYTTDSGHASFPDRTVDTLDATVGLFDYRITGYLD